MTALRVVLDTNVLVSGLAYPDSIPGRIVRSWRNGSLEVALSHHILDELARVLPRMNHRLHWSPQDIQDYIDSLLFLVDLVEPEPMTDPRLRDADDQPVLATLVAAEARYLITGDRDLLALAAHYPILSPADFWQRHGS